MGGLEKKKSFLGRWEGGSGRGRHVNPRPFHFNVLQNSLQKKKKKTVSVQFSCSVVSDSMKVLKRPKIRLII